MKRRASRQACAARGQEEDRHRHDRPRRRRIRPRPWHSSSLEQAQGRRCSLWPVPALWAEKDLHRSVRGNPPVALTPGDLTMEYVKLGRTGLEVSRICLGCMSYGVPDRGNHAWSIGEEDSRPFIKRALEGGVNFFDTANRYSLGSSEEILGRAIKDFARRDEVVIATKVYGRMRPGPNGAGLSRKGIFAEIDNRLS